IALYGNTLCRHSFPENCFLGVHLSPSQNGIPAGYQVSVVPKTHHGFALAFPSRHYRGYEHRHSPILVGLALVITSDLRLIQPMLHENACRGFVEERDSYHPKPLHFEEKSLASV